MATTTEPLVKPAVTVTEEGIDAIAAPPADDRDRNRSVHSRRHVQRHNKIGVLSPVTLAGLKAALLKNRWSTALVCSEYLAAVAPAGTTTDPLAADL